MRRVGIITQARMTSTRLPGKVLIEVAGKSMLGHQLDRLTPIGVPVTVATTVNDIDDGIVAEAAAHGASTFRGGEQDVLARFAGAAKAAGLDVVVRVTADCPLIDPAVIREGIERFLTLDDPYAHVSNVLQRTYPRGFDFEVFSTQALIEADHHATEPSDREHVTPYLYANRSGRFTMHAVRRESDASAYRVTLDTAADLELIRRLIIEHHAQTRTAEEIIGVLESNPDLAAINAHIEQKKPGR
ncbi:glycosyltransferase family protein [Microbacterium sp.]|uniref:glycosyltransferase family protein n=1 Tax=Microbacterium sp. TaxID=51671 RepID=UPI002812362D|nr:glycosyltransferase family protein [Microbacterium sp.]